MQERKHSKKYKNHNFDYEAIPLNNNTILYSNKTYGTYIDNNDNKKTLEEFHSFSLLPNGLIAKTASFLDLYTLVQLRNTSKKIRNILEVSVQETPFKMPDQSPATLNDFFNEYKYELSLVERYNQKIKSQYNRSCCDSFAVTLCSRCNKSETDEANNVIQRFFWGGLSCLPIMSVTECCATGQVSSAGILAGGLCGSFFWFFASTTFCLTQLELLKEEVLAREDEAGHEIRVFREEIKTIPILTAIQRKEISFFQSRSNDMNTRPEIIQMNYN